MTNDQGFDFDAPVIEKREGSVEDAAQLKYQTYYEGGSLVIVLVALFGAWVFTRRFARASHLERGSAKEATLVHPAWHLLSLLVQLFLAGNVFFGMLSAFLLTGGDAQATSDYFIEMSPFKLAKLSHQHFFGYGILFGIMALFAFVFVGKDKRRIVYPALVGFVFAALDVASWWLSHFVNVGFHMLSVASGMIFSIAFFALFLQTTSKNIATLLRHR